MDAVETLANYGKASKDGTIRMLKVPTIADRAWQCLAKYALEPAHEATFHARSYGFRTGRSAHDAQKILHIDGNHDNWDKKNLVAIHESCHDYIHMDRRGKVVTIHDPVSH